MNDDVNRENVEDENVKNDGGVIGGQAQSERKPSLAEFLKAKPPKKSVAQVVMHMDEIKALRHQGYSLPEISEIMREVRGIRVSVANLQQILFRSAGPVQKLNDATPGAEVGVDRPKAPRRTRKSFDATDIERELQEIERWREIKSRSATLISEILNEAPPVKKAGAAGTASGTGGAGVSGAAVASPPGVQDLGRDVSDHAARNTRPAATKSPTSTAISTDAAEFPKRREPWKSSVVSSARAAADDALEELERDRAKSGGIFAKPKNISQNGVQTVDSIQLT